MSNIDKHAVQAVADLKAGYTLGHADVAILNELARIALASLEAEAVCVIDQSNLDYLKSGSDADVWPASRTEMGDVLLYRAAPPAPVSVPDNVTAEDCPAFIKYDLTEVDESWARGFNACRAAMHQGAEPVSNRDELPDDFDFDRFNDVVWLEAVASNPHMHSPTTSTIAMVALELNKKLADGKPELTVWYGSMPESNGKANWTAILHRKGEGRCMDGFTIDRSEYPGRVLYAADRVRYLIGEKSERPSILDYDADAHSGYVKPGNSPVIPECSCHACRPVTFADSRFVVCPDCGNKRCPHANDHRNACTGSNEPGQEGSAYPAAPQQEVK
ncbi:hypothetical protein M8S88_05915 [Enterobacter hormaechei]|nr:hypothetical protein [Enterobacter hormaechei]